MARRRGPLAFPIVFLCLCPAAVRAQDSQYWTLQYGPVAELLGGVVVGSSRDLSATFYNPGALALAKDPSLLASVASRERRERGTHKTQRNNAEGGENGPGFHGLVLSVGKTDFQSAFMSTTVQPLVAASSNCWSSVHDHRPVSVPPGN